MAEEQVVVVPIWQEDTRDDVLAYAESVTEELDDAGIRVHLDDRDERNPGFKFNEWELFGVPVRLEIGPHEVEDETVTVVHRPDGESTVEEREDLDETVEDHLEAVHEKLFEAAEENLEENIREASEVSEILGTIGRYGGYVKTAWCGDEACETVIKDEIAAEIVMVPLEDDVEPPADDCAVCGDPAVETAYFARTY